MGPIRAGPLSYTFSGSLQRLFDDQGSWRWFGLTHDVGVSLGYPLVKLERGNSECRVGVMAFIHTRRNRVVRGQEDVDAYVFVCDNFNGKSISMTIVNF